MTLPANIRVNLAVPFPAFVLGSSFITLGKVNGVWVIQTNGDLLGAANPGASATDYVIVWDDIAKAFIRVSLANLITQAQATRAQRSVTASPITVGPTDSILNVNIAAGTPACTLPQASTRGGAPVTFKDVGGNFAAHPLTITAFAGDNIDGLGSFFLTANRQAVTLVPFNDGTNTGWAVE